MFGLACKGLHCAGCGKGIPAGVVLLFLGIMAAVNRGIHLALGELANAVAAFFIAMSIALPCSIVVTGAIMAFIGARFSGLSVSKWDGPTYSEQWELANAERLEPAKYGLPQWPNVPMIETRHVIPDEWKEVPNAHLVERSGDGELGHWRNP